MLCHTAVQAQAFLLSVTFMCLRELLLGSILSQSVKQHFLQRFSLKQVCTWVMLVMLLEWTEWQALWVAGYFSVREICLLSCYFLLCCIMKTSSMPAVILTS